MAPLYAGTDDEWFFLSSDISTNVRTLDFKIANFEAEMKKGSHKLISRFRVKNSVWSIYVNQADKDEENLPVSVALRNESPENMTVDYKCRIGKLVLGRESEMVESMGQVKFTIPPEQCKALLSDGNLIVELKLIKEEDRMIHGEKFNLTEETSNVDRKIFDEMSFPDFKVICNGKEFPCHKAFLAARSSVFKTMLEADMKEAIVEIKNQTEIVVEQFVKFFYTSHVEEDALKSHAVDFLGLGEQYQVEGLKKMTEQAMIANLSIENMLRYLVAGDKYQSEDLKKAAKAFIRKNKKSLAEQAGWRDAVTDKDLLLDVIEILTKD